jgi:hypothetical protein
MADVPSAESSPGWADRVRLFEGGSGIITGTVVCAAVIAASAGHTNSVAELSAAIVGTVLVYWLAHLHAEAIGGAVSRSHDPVTAVRRAAADTWTIGAASLLPLVVLLLSKLAGANLSQASWAALAATVALLAAYSYLAGRRGGLGISGSIVCSIAGAALGVLVAALKAALH